MIHPDELLSAFLDGELSPEETSTLVTHLQECDACRRELEGLADARSAVRGLPMLELPPDILRGISTVIPLRRRVRVWVGAAAAAIAILLGVSVATRTEPVTFDVDELQTILVVRSSGEGTLTQSKVVIAPVGFVGGQG